jgi:hypothetical protein
VLNGRDRERDFTFCLLHRNYRVDRFTVAWVGASGALDVKRARERLR